MAGGSYGRSASLSDSLTNALLIRSFAPREMRPSGPILVLRTLGPQGWGRWFLYLVDLKSVRERPSIRNRLHSATESPRRFHKPYVAAKPQKPQRSATLRAPGRSM